MEAGLGNVAVANRNLERSASPQLSFEPPDRLSITPDPEARRVHAERARIRTPSQPEIGG